MKYLFTHARKIWKIHLHIRQFRLYEAQLLIVLYSIEIERKFKYF